MTKYAFILLLVPVLSFGDTYPKNPNIDVLHYVFSINLSDETNEIEGLASITFLFKIAGINQVRLDFTGKSSEGKGMLVKNIYSNGSELSYTHTGNVLLILVPPSQADGTITISISYTGTPASGLIIGPNKYGDRTFFSDNWPNRARNWLPTVDHPYDKATSEFIVTAPAKYQVISNGLKIEETSLDNGLKRTHWNQSVPISSWLYVLGVAEFAVQYVDEFEGKSIQTWVYKQDRDAGFYDFAVPTKKVLAFYSDYVGPFAYEKLANIQSNSVGGGMEAASAILYGDNSVSGKRDKRWRNVVIHEIAHQWFGNAVTEYDWDDVWLSEGFATYFTLLYIEHAYGRDEFVKGLKSARNRVFSFYQNNKDYRIVHDNLDDMSKVTTGNTYQKGAWILHMLRQKMGDENFEKGIKNYYNKYMNSNATTAQFRKEMEAVHGASLDHFFQQWLYHGGNVVIEGSWKFNDEKKLLEVNLSQLQNDGSNFDVKVNIGVYYADQAEPDLFAIELSDNVTSTFTLKNKPVKVVIDPNTQLLATWTLNQE